MAQKMPTVKQLKYFVCVAEFGTFRGAAERLGISQPTLTAQIYSLEKALQLTLLERSRSGTELTPAGRELLPNARQVMEEMHGLLDQAALINQGPSGTFRIGVSPTVGPYLLPHILPGLHQTYSSLKLYVRENMPKTLELDLLEGRLDLVLIPLPFGTSRLTSEVLFHEPLHLVVPEGHQLGKLKQIKAEHLREQNILTLESQHSSYHRVEAVCEELGANIARDYEGTSLDALRQMVMMGVGVAFLPSLYIHSEIHQPQGLSVSQIEELQLHRTHVLAWRKNSPNRSFYRQLVELIRSLVKANLSDAQLFFDD
ncbi:hydrogen peroxide-inducible genes activator [Pseudomaricurvus alkylphenolicus]|jgi:LysR family hydrogen peroxide-inducible transcriptional activator|uniref:hydrogen peroxide-inducible genes activator n=1 Tax=Pseudomaricurvus alkylphenolicus TaxID=1306991 RepID=UPI001420BE0A|nr:hydrogen peroxide-inducible genes activator [Pseudomaricurvus alkylphenolicus]NIB41440.1 hydrogen peroxide-inducible genes activator [Pseudomaricurvus alkylphenolicus]